MTEARILEVSIQGMDCMECTAHVREAIGALKGVSAVEVFLASEKAVIEFDPERVQLDTIRNAVEKAGYRTVLADMEVEKRRGMQKFVQPVLVLLGVVFGTVLFVVVVGEWLGFFEAISSRIPWPISLGIILLLGYPVLLNVIRAAFRGQVISHTLMTCGVIAAIWVGEWATAAVVVFFMRVGDYTERFTTERSRRAVKELVELAPKIARVEQMTEEVEIPISEVLVGDIVVVRPGEKIPVDGTVVSGTGTVDQAAITGESMPAELGTGGKVYASSLLSLGSLRIRTEAVGINTTYGGVIRLVQEAEGNRAQIQRIADRFSGYYLPIVAGIAVMTYLLRGDARATAAVLVVACSCAFTLSTPIAMLASIGAAARQGVLIKGGKYLERLEKVDTVLLDKTGTLTFGKPKITDILVMLQLPEWAEIVNGQKVKEEDLPAAILRLAASAERFSEHPLAAAIREAARERGIELALPEDFTSEPGVGVSAVIEGCKIEVSNSRRAAELAGYAFDSHSVVGELEGQGKTLSFVFINETLAGVIAAQDSLRPEVPLALQQLHLQGVKHIELLTGDHFNSAQNLVTQIQNSIQAISGDYPSTIKLTFQAGLLPADKIKIVREYQGKGHIVAMVGDGVNDAPALAQADVGLGMGSAGITLAVEAAHIALMREDWGLVPEVFRVSRRTMRVVRMNIAFTTIYNLVGLSLAAFGLLSPIFAAAMQSLPDLGILANSSRLIRHKAR